ncbi:MAG: amidohydrolase [Bacillota bacterium]|nr:amidohydrolase [Bacillota bacterium]
MGEMTADLVLKNGKVYSVALDGTVTRGQAVAVCGGKIAAVGSNEEVEGYIGENTRIVDAGGNTILPGFCDGHVHASYSSSALFACNLFMPPPEKGGRRALVEAYQKALTAYMEQHPEDPIIRGAGWNLGYFGPNVQDWPTRADLDAICPDKPMVLESFCQHHSWINSRALELAGITKDTPTPRNGSIFRDAEGEPTGLFSEFSAINLVKLGIPGCDFSVEEYKNTLRIYQRDLANHYGVTLIFDALCSENAREAYKELARDGELTLRVRGNYYAESSLPPAQFREMAARKGSDDIGDLYQVNTVKFFMEGSANGFYMGEPFEAAYLQSAGLPEGYRGFAFWTKEELEQAFAYLMEEGFQIHTHAMGDESVTVTLDGYEYAAEATGKDTRNVVAHLMLVKERDMERMGRLRTIGCVQPTWMFREPMMDPIYEFQFGRKRKEQLYPYRRLVEAGAVVSMGTDFPVTPPPDPFVELESAVTRSIPRMFPGHAQFKDLVAGPESDPAQDCVDLAEAVKGLTICGAYQNFAEDVTGSIEVGKSAELVLIDRDLEASAAEDIHDTHVLMTVFKGKVVYERS